MTFGFSILLSAALAGGAPAVPKAPPVVIIHAKDYSFVAPTTVSSGATTFRLVNDGKELHHMSITKLAKGKTMADMSAALKNPGPPPAWMTDVGGPNPALPGGGTAEATLTLEPGDYVMMCFISSPGETTPHLMKGMMRAFTVTPAKTDASEPAADVTIHLSDYKFTVSKPLTAGHHVINVVNDASQSHEVVLAELGPGKTMADVGNWVEKGLMKGPPPGKPIAGIAALSKGRSGIFPVDLKPGHYGLICFIPDLKDGKSHFVHGMTQEITVK
jgi:uncharacterized cupredoxin-like copper-binding protein